MFRFSLVSFFLYNFQRRSLAKFMIIVNNFKIIKNKRTFHFSNHLVLSLSDLNYQAVYEKMILIKYFNKKKQIEINSYFN